jgi:putative membrane protein
VTELVVKILVNAAALWVAVQVLPDNLLAFDFGNDWWKLLVVALVFALVNSYIRPIVKALSFPISIMTLGLVAFVINAAMLLLTAALSNQLDLGFTVGDFPPTIASSDTIVGALAGAIVISVVSTVVSLALAPRRLL